MAFSESREDTTARVKEQADIVQVISECIDLKQSGARHLGLCPFHGEKTPSFSVHGGQQFFHCFGCGESGDVFSFIMKYFNLDFPGALKQLAQKYNIELPERRQSKEELQREKKRDQLFAINQKCANIYSQYLEKAPGAEMARNYLRERGVSGEVQENFRLGYAPAVDDEGWNYLSRRLNSSEVKFAVEAGLLVAKDNGGTYDRFRDRVVFPISDLSGRVCGFGGRIVGEGQPKYLNSPESQVFNKSKLLLGLFQQKEAIRKQGCAVLVEGNFDLISLVDHGCTNVVAPLGTALTREQLRLVKRFAGGVTLLFDGDEAGVKAAVRSVPFFLAEQIPARVALLPKDHDPDSYVRESGLKQLNTLLDEAESLPEFVLNRLLEEFGTTLDGKSRIVEELRPLIKVAVSPLQRSLFVSHFAQELGMEADNLDALLDRPTQKTAVPSENTAVVINRKEQCVPLTIAQKQLVEFMVLQPRFFHLLAEGGLRDCLEGSIGEILFLQMESLLSASTETEPEELLSVLPQGVERTLVSDLLLGAPGHGEEASPEDELTDRLEYLKIFKLKKDSASIMRKMKQAEREGDLQTFQDLMLENLRITKTLHGEDM